MKKLKFSLQSDTGTLSESDAQRYFSALGAAVAVMMAVYYALVFALSFALARFAPWVFSNPILNNVLSLLPLYGVAFPLFYLMLRRLPRDRVQPEKMSGKDSVMGFCVAITLMMAGNYVGNFVIALLEATTGTQTLNPVESMTSGHAWWINLIFMAIFPPILEELVFRKILCERLLPLGEGYAIVLSSVIFGLVHGNFYQFFYAFTLGLLFSLIYVKTGRIRYSVIYHMLINLGGGVFAPWVLNKLSYLMREDTLNELLDLAQTNPEAAMELLAPYLLPLVLLLAYELLMMGAAICGIVFFVIGRRKLRLESGLLPPPKKRRLSLVLLNPGVAAALAVFAGIFILSLL